MKQYEEKSYLADDKIEDIKRLIETMSKNKKIIESIIDVNSNLIKKPLELQNQIEEAIECLPDQMRLLNLNQSSMFSPFNMTLSSLNSSLSQSTALPVLEDYFINDYEQFKSKIKPNQIQIFNTNDKISHECSSLVQFLNYPDYKSKHEIFDEIIKMLNLIEIQSAAENIDTMQSLNDLKNLESSLRECEEEDKRNLPKYSDLISKRIETCAKWKNTKEQVRYESFVS